MTYSSTVLATAGLNTYWRLGESSGNAVDSSGNGHTGTVEGSPTYSATGLLTGDANKAFGVDGVDDGIGATGTGLGDNYSMECWVVNTQAPAAQFIAGYLLSRGQNGTGSNFDAVGIMGNFDGGNQGKFFAFNAVDLLYGTTVTTEGTPYHLVFVRNGTNVKLYVNGVAEIDATLAKTFSVADVSAARRIDSGGALLKGTIDEVAYYDAALDAATVLAHYNAGLTAPGSGYSRLRAQFQLRPY